MVICYYTLKSSGSMGEGSCSVFDHFWDPEGTVQGTEWVLHLYFLTDITGKLKHLNTKKKQMHFPSVQSVLNDNASASGAFGTATGKYCQLIDRL